MAEHDEGHVEQPKVDASGIKAKIQDWASDVITETVFKRWSNYFQEKYNQKVRGGIPTMRYQLEKGHDTKSFKTYRELYNIKSTLNPQLRQVEKAWMVNLDGFRQRMRTPYLKVGPYTNPNITNELKELFEFGTSNMHHKSATIDEDWNNKYEEFVFTINNKDYSIKIPKELGIKMQDGFKHYFRTFGHEKIKPELINKYKDIIQQIFDDKIQSLNPTIDQKKINYLNKYKNMIINVVMDKFREELQKIERDAWHKFEVMNITGTSGIINLLEQAKDLSIDKKFKEAVFYGHDFMIFGPGLTQAEFMANKDQMNLDTSQIKNSAGEDVELVEYTPKPNELDWGLDDNGWPLELMRDPSNHKKWYVQIDLIDREITITGKIRVRAFVEKELGKIVVPLEPLHSLAYRNNHYDMYRDSMRDARYNRTLLAYDYGIATSLESEKFRELWTRLKAPGEKYMPKRLSGEFLTKKDEDEMKKVQSYKMRIFDKRPTNTGIPEWHEIWVDGVRRSDNLQPGFDKRAIDNPKKGVPWGVFMGTRKYYDPPEKLRELTQMIHERAQSGLSSSKISKRNALAWGPKITTRGISMYLFDNVYRVEGAVDQIEKAFKQLAGDGADAGYDIGPRIFGEDFSQTPLESDIKTLNEKIAGKVGWET